jgi:hypothetical protein
LVFQSCLQRQSFLPNIFAIWPQSRSDYISLFYILTGHAVAEAQVIPLFLF